ncbi:hypothetical protein V0288_04010 [Pannus brasiliensis CCIBt3594]|uniref:REase AHJR-like domain-containing protein n=1 Tax=Pannus brasiliensis CCIBt3594 TaxID=1427578 RepID=A0AAW9QUK6_9CHRO
MAIVTEKQHGEQLLKVANDYKAKGFEVIFQPQTEDLPDFMKNYRPDLLARRGEESVIVEVKSRSSLDSATAQYLSSLSREIKKHPGWTFQLVMINPEKIDNNSEAVYSWKLAEIEKKFANARQLIQYPEAAILYLWSLIEALLRLLAEKEEVSIREVNPSYLIKKLTVEGVIDRNEYQMLTNAFSLRNALAHGFTPLNLPSNSVEEFIKLTEQLLLYFQDRRSSADESGSNPNA